ncbi:hypothetical protein Pcac1_g27187 [Phytophthora cactorum]|nr:hypothetical protein Pcac1_g27187 [Phytophthora cactorum]
MPSTPQSTKKQRQHERAAANARVVRAFKESANWREVAAHNDVPYSTARRAALNADGEPTTHGGVRGVRVKMTMKVMGKLEQYLDEDCRHTCEQMCDRVHSNLGVSVSTSSVHRALQGMVYSLKKLRIEKVTMNKAENKNKRKEFVNKLEKHASRGDMIVFHDETNFNMGEDMELRKTCSVDYAYDNIATCWAQCPLNYPVQCGRECIPQSDDCALEVITKIESVAAVALNAATSGVFGQLSTASAAVQQGVKCGQKLVTVVENIVGYAKELQSNFPNGTEEQIISLLNNSDIVVKDLPTAVCICLGLDVPTDYLNLASDVIRKVLSVITDNQIWPSDNDSGKALSTADYILKLDDMGLDVIAMFDPTGIAKMLEEFIQPICGPTSFIGEIDDGFLADALALVADGGAIASSYGTWTHAGDGAVNIVLEGTDTEDVTVEIHSGGDGIDSVKVKSGETATWNSTVSTLQDKTMYFDRWHLGLVGLPGSGGGSLVMWVPRSSAGGRIDLVAKIYGS